MPQVVVLAGPNGAGKSTAAPSLLRDALAVPTFVNADDIARGLSGFAPEAAAVAAGRVMLARLAELTRAGETFAFETTLAGRGMRGVLRRCLESGYRVHIVFLWLPSPDIAVARVRRRVQLGGHDVPEPVVRRRFERGLVNFFDSYRPLCTTWRLFDASAPLARPMIAHGRGAGEAVVVDSALWAIVQEQVRELREHAGGEHDRS